MLPFRFSDLDIAYHLQPFSLTRQVEDFRIGILTIKEKWELLFNKFPEAFLIYPEIIPANLVPDINNFKIILNGEFNGSSIRKLIRPWQIFQLNDEQLRSDFKLLTEGRVSSAISDSNVIIGREHVFLEEGAQVEGAIINAQSGPVYIGKNALIMEGAMIRGPFAALENSVVKMGAKIYGATTLGPYSVAGGEIKNVMFFGFSNKAHDGYLGDSVIGEWCNLGAGTTNSNVKNTGGTVFMQIDEKSSPEAVGMKAGLLLGDYCRTAINTSFYTGVTTGICCNIFGEPVKSKYLSSFTWGTTRYELEKALKDIGYWKKMKNQEITETEIQLLNHIYQKTS